jgi:hypothetical protein
MKIHGVWLGLALLAAPIGAQVTPWSHTGLLRVRDLTPFGVLRLDFLPAHAVTAKPGTWAMEVNLSYQNTYVMSENVADYLGVKGGGGRVELTQEDFDALAKVGEEAYFVDLEMGLLDLTAHYRFSPHWGGYVTLPVLSFRDGFLDSTIEGFHEQFGFDTAHRDLAVRDQLQVLVLAEGAQMAIFEPRDEGVGDPVLGARYSMVAEPDRWNLILEGAVKVAWSDERPLLSSGKSDAGVQLSYQKFFNRQAFYLTGSAVYFSGSDNPVTPDLEQVIPTVVLGWERRLTRRTNGILQLYASPSVVQDSNLDELTAKKYLLSLGFQTQRGGWFYRYALTENLQNFSNTPDVGLTFSVARVVFGR